MKYPEGPTSEAQVDSADFDARLIGENELGSVYLHGRRPENRQQTKLGRCQLPLRRPLALLYRRGESGRDRPHQRPRQHHLGNAQETLPHQAGREDQSVRPLGQPRLDSAGELQRQNPPAQHHRNGNFPHLRNVLDPLYAQRGSVSEQPVPGRLHLLGPQGNRRAPGEHRSGRRERHRRQAATTWSWKRRWTSPSASRPSGTPR